MAKQYLSCTNLTYQYESAKRPIIEKLSLTCSPGWTAFVGANGTGKTTLLKILCGIIPVQEGAVSTHLLCSYVDQQTDRMPEALETFIGSYDSEAIRYKELLSVEYDWAYRWETLSSGEQKRAQIGTALFLNPDVLAVDEPTNHLDGDSAQKVIAALNSFRGVGLIVSHDRSLLEQMPHETLLFMMNRIRLFHCSWGEAVRETEHEQQHREEQNAILRKQIKKIKSEEISRRNLSNSTKQRLSKKSLGAKDRDGRAKIDAARLTGKDSVDGRAAERLESRREHLEKQIDSSAYHKTYSSEMSLRAAVDHKKVVIDLAEGSVDFNEFRLLSYKEFQLRQGEKVAMTGRNGIGKSTFLKKIMVEGVVNAGECLYIPQEISQEEGSRLLHEIRNTPRMDLGMLFTIVKRLGSDPKQLLDSDTPSPGELRKLLLARAMQSEFSLIILDEPTNHLDILTIRSLEAALQVFAGALLFVSHDTQFVSAVADRIFHINEGDGHVAFREVFAE